MSAKLILADEMCYYKDLFLSYYLLNTICAMKMMIFLQWLIIVLNWKPQKEWVLPISFGNGDRIRNRQNRAGIYLIRKKRLGK